jgi:hypothetical protein
VRLWDPFAVLSWPDVTLFSAPWPVATLSCPVVVVLSALTPTPMLLMSLTRIPKPVQANVSGLADEKRAPP